jgi:hypothetical protein
MELIEKRPPVGSLPGEWEPSKLIRIAESGPQPRVRQLDVDPHSTVLFAEDVLGSDDCRILREAFLDSNCGCAVDVFGFSGEHQGHGLKTADCDDSMGSLRATAWSPELADQLWKRLCPLIPATREMFDITATDWHAPVAHRKWGKLALSPVLRFMSYIAGGQHCCHYDNSFDYGDGRRTLMSVVFYLTSVGPKEGGATRFVRDGQENLPIGQRSFADWTRLTEPHEVIERVPPIQGSALVFDHRLCHDVEQYHGSTPRVIIRGDVVFIPQD